MGGAESRGHPWPPLLASKWLLFQRGTGISSDCYCIASSSAISEWYVRPWLLSLSYPMPTLCSFVQSFCDPTAVASLCTSTMHRSCRQQACLPSSAKWLDLEQNSMSEVMRSIPQWFRVDRPGLSEDTQTHLDLMTQRTVTDRHL